MCKQVIIKSNNTIVESNVSSDLDLLMGQSQRRGSVENASFGVIFSIFWAPNVTL